MPTIGQEIEEELRSARMKHAPMNGAHEGYAIILEELDELWDLVKAQKPDKTRMRGEALQVAAMAARFVEDLCDRKPHPGCKCHPPEGRDRVCALHVYHLADESCECICT